MLELGPNKTPLALLIVSGILILNGALLALYGNLVGIILVILGCGVFYKYKLCWLLISSITTLRIANSLYVLADHFLSYKVHLIKRNMAYINYNAIKLHILSLVINIILIALLFNKRSRQYFKITSKKIIYFIVIFGVLVSTILYIVNFKRPWELY